MIEIRPSQSSELELLKSIYGDTSKSKADVNLPYGVDLSANLLENQTFVSAVFIWTIWFDGQPVGSAYHSYMPRYNVALLALGLTDLYRGKNIGTEIGKMLIHRIFELTPAHRIEAGTTIENLASNRVMEKCGFTKEGVFRKGIIVEGRKIDYIMYGILKEDLKNETIYF